MLTCERRLSVLIPLPLPGPYDYVAQEGESYEVGELVRVPLASRQVTGVVWALSGSGGGDEVPEEKLKAVAERLPVPPLPPKLVQFIDWVAAYTLSPPGSVLRLALRSREALLPPRMLKTYVLSGEMPARITSARERVIRLFADKLPRTPKEITDEAGVSSAVVSGLAKAGALNEVARPADLPFPLPKPDYSHVELSPEQQVAADGLVAAVRAQEFAPQLLDGVAGSGKTETYFEAVAEALRMGRQTLILLPEIALTAQFLGRFEKRFGVAPALWHSDVSTKERRRTWRKIIEGQARIVVGARSALFLPYSRLGLIVVDEEHETAFKQEEGVIYHARDMAVVRASIENIPIVLASATPSIETVANVAQGKYERFVLPGRFGSARLPDIKLLDLRTESPESGHWLSPVLVDALKETLARGEQSLLFLNRRGYAPLTLCRKCGHRMTSPETSSWLVEHRFQKKLVCHLTGFSMPKPERCPSCGAKDSLVGCGPGVERITEEVRELFPNAHIAVMSSDTMTGPRSTEELVGRMQRGEIDLLIGTQLVAKGYHFPKLTTVGVVDADLGLSGGDLRASERTFQLLSQVAGRAGREDLPGTAYLQTHMPDHPVLRAIAAQDRDAFLAAEMAERQTFALPPYGRMVAFVISDDDSLLVKKTAQQIVSSAPQEEGIDVFGPAPAPISLLRGRHRWRVLLKASIGANVQSYVRRWFAGMKVPTRVRISVDVDPYSFM